MHACRGSHVGLELIPKLLAQGLGSLFTTSTWPTLSEIALITLRHQASELHRSKYADADGSCKSKRHMPQYNRFRQPYHSTRCRIKFDRLQPCYQLEITWSRPCKHGFTHIGIIMSSIADADNVMHTGLCHSAARHALILLPRHTGSAAQCQQVNRLM